MTPAARVQTAIELLDDIVAAAREGGAAADTLRHADPRPDIVLLEGIPSTPSWSRLLARGWTGGALVHDAGRSLPAPALSVANTDFDAWLRSKSANFRQQMRRAKRAVERDGGTIRLMTARDETADAVRAFVELHRSRWDSRGGSNLLRPGLDGMLCSVAARLQGSGRFRVWVLEAEGKPVSVQLFLEAGGEVAYWNGGFDETWSRYRPALLTLLAAVEHAFGAGDRRVSFGGGGGEYKYRFSDHEEVLAWKHLIPIGPRYPVVRAACAPGDLMRTLSGRLSPEAKRRLRSLRRATSHPGLA